MREIAKRAHEEGDEGSLTWEWFDGPALQEANVVEYQELHSPECLATCVSASPSISRALGDTSCDT